MASGSPAPGLRATAQPDYASASTSAADAQAELDRFTSLAARDTPFQLVFIVLFSHQTMSYSQILFAHPTFVPSKDMYHDFPSGCPNPGCTDNCCELIRFPKKGPAHAAVLCPQSKSARRKVRYRYGRRARHKEMCNWIECDICFSDDRDVLPLSGSEGSSEGSVEGSDLGSEYSTGSNKALTGLVCSRCKLVKYCSADHQGRDWEEHKRVCAKPLGES